MIHEKITTKYKDKIIKATSPVIISASRRTDIPAFFLESFLKDLKSELFQVKNPYNRKIFFISTLKTRAIVFWTRNPVPILSKLSLLKDYKYYFLITVTDYKKENLEPNMPDVKERIKNFIKLSEVCGPLKCIWRFDPVLLTLKLSINELLDRISFIAQHLKGYTNELIFSFVDTKYKKIKNKNLEIYSPSQEERIVLADNISKICKENNLTPITCATEEDFQNFGIIKDGCISKRYLQRLNDEILNKWLILNDHKKDPGQRKSCLCLPSIDIGTYRTCNYNCKYCYAL